MTPVTPPTQPSHGHLDEEEIPEAGNLTVHWHEGGEKPHRHAYKMVGGPSPDMRWMPPSYIARRESEDWS